MLAKEDIKQIGLLSLFGLSMIWSPMFGTSEGLVFGALAAHENAALISRICNLAAFGLVMGILSFAGERLRQIGTKRTAMVAAVALGAAGMALGALTGMELVPLPTLYAGAALRGVFYGLVTVSWLEVLIHLDGNRIGIAVAAVLVVYALTGMVILAAEAWIPVLAALFLTASPVFSAAGCVGACSCVSMETPIAQENAKAPFLTRCLLYLANFAFGIMLGALLYYFALYDSPLALGVFLAASLVLLGVFALGDDVSVSTVYRACMVVAAVGGAIVMLAGWLTQPLATLMASGALAFLILYTVVIFTDTQARSREPYWKLPGMCQVFASLGMIAASAMFQRVFPEGTVSSLQLMLLAAVCIIFVAGVFSPSDRMRQRPWGFSSLIPAESPEARAMRRCGELANEHGLTSRELEILQMLATGMGKDGVAEALVISPTTAKTHIRNIYSKLGVHSQRELAAKLDL